MAAGEARENARPETFASLCIAVTPLPSSVSSSSSFSLRAVMEMKTKKRDED
jgi:hypothetical protein